MTNRQGRIFIYTKNNCGLFMQSEEHHYDDSGRTNRGIPVFSAVFSILQWFSSA